MRKLSTKILGMLTCLVILCQFVHAKKVKDDFFPTFLLCAMNADLEFDLDKEFQRKKEHNINMINAFWRNPDVSGKFLKKAEEYGIKVWITANTYCSSGPTSEKDMWILNAKGNPVKSYVFSGDNYYPCWNNPKQRNNVKKRLESIVREGSKYSSFLGIVFDDEATLGWYGKDGLCCYCPVCKALFKKKTGLESPAWSNEEVRKRYPKGIVDDSDVWVKWNEFRCDTLANYYSWCQDIVKSMNPNLINSTLNGGAQTIILGNEFPKSWKALDVVCPHFYPFKHPVLEIALATENGYRSAKAINKDLWVAIQGHEVNLLPKGEKPVVEPDFWREQVWLALSGGAKGIGSFPGLGGRSWSPFNKPELANEMKKVFGEIKKFGHVLQKTEKMPADTAILQCWSTEIFEQMFENGHVLEAWSHWHKLEEIYYVFLRANVPVDVIFEDDILNNRIKDYKNIILFDVGWLRKSVAEKLEKFVGKGGNLYLDEECEIQLKGYKRLPLQFGDWYKLICKGNRDRRILAPIIERKAKKIKLLFGSENLPASTESKDILLRYLQCKGFKILFAINDSMKWPYIKKGKEPKKVEALDAAFSGGAGEKTAGGIVKGESRLAKIKIKDVHLKIYDLRKEEWITPRKTKSGLIIEKEIPSGDALILILTRKEEKTW